MICVRDLKKDKYECDECVYKWDIQSARRCCNGGCCNGGGCKGGGCGDGCDCCDPVDGCAESSADRQVAPVRSDVDFAAVLLGKSDSGNTKTVGAELEPSIKSNLEKAQRMPWYQRLISQ
ncbi:hypothetical protein OAS39_03870 [Pirellulales bacterium]|nr:hypothetical protein [Pirellulales bacterium]